MVANKKNIFLFIFSSLFFYPVFILCSDFSISLELSGIRYIKKNNVVTPTVFLGESFDLKAVISGTKRAANQPEIKGLENFEVIEKKPHTKVLASSSNVLIEKISSYNLTPNKLETFTIGPATFLHKGKKITSNIVTVEVARRTEKLESELTQKYENKSLDPPKEYELFCKLEADKTEVFTEEPITVTVSIYYRGTIAGVSGLQPPQFPNCTVKEVELAQKSMSSLNNKSYSVIKKTYLIFPKKPGTLFINPARAIYNVRVKQDNRGSSLFNQRILANFFNLGVKQKSSVSNSLTIEVKKIPAHKKQLDGIGNFSLFSASVDKTKALINEPIKFILSISGVANFDLVLPLKPVLPEIFKSYDSKTEFHESTSQDISAGTKNFEFIVQIPKAGTFTILPQTFFYFDTKTKSHKTLKTKPIIISVKMPAGGTPSLPKLILDEDQEQEFMAPVAQTDIHFIHEDVPASKKKTRRIPISFLIILSLLIPFVFYFKTVTRLFKKLLPKQKKLLPDYQKQLSIIISNKKLEESYPFFVNLFAKLFYVHKNIVNEDWVQTKLEETGFEKEKIYLFLKFFRDCAQYSFTAQYKEEINKETIEKFEQEANYWLLFIYQTIKNKGKSQ